LKVRSSLAIGNRDNAFNFKIQLDPMKISSPFIAVVFCIFACSLGAQTTVPPPPSRSFNNPTIVPPPPSRPSTAVRVYPPDPPSITFGNGGNLWAKVWIYRDKFIVMDRDRQTRSIKRPLPDQARNPGGCAWLRYWLNTHDCHSGAWKGYLEIYLYRCLNLR